MKSMFTIFLAIVIINLFAQCPTENSIIITNQADLEALVSSYPNCHELDALYLEGFDISDISVLEQFTKYSLLSLSETSITNLNGIQNISEIDVLVFHYNSLLTDISALIYDGELERFNFLNNNNSITNLNLNFHGTLISFSILTNYPLNVTCNFSSDISIDNITLRGEINLTCNKIISIYKKLHLSESYQFYSFNRIYEVFAFDSLDFFEYHNTEYFSFDGIKPNTNIGNLSISNINEASFDDIDNSNLMVYNLFIGNIEYGLSSLHHFANFKLKSLTIGTLDSIENINDLGDLSDLEAFNIGFMDDLIDISKIMEVDTFVGIFDCLVIVNNPKLLDCAIEPICEKLIGPHNSFQVSIKDNAGNCLNEAKVLESCTSSIDEGKSKSDILIYPNPVNSIIYLSSKADEIALYSITGKLILKSKDMDIINVQNVKNGIYFLNLRIGNYQSTQKLVIQK
jgi:hypothetical protein